MISHAKKFILVHVPRTGGTLVEARLGHYGITLQGERNYASLYFKHALARDIRRMMGEEYERYFKFSVVRNPWDWVVSNYAYNRGLHQCYVGGTRYERERTPGRIPDWAKDMRFEDWLRWWLEEFKPSQLALLSDAAGGLLVDEVCRFETLREDLKRICRRLELQPVAREADTRSPQRDADYRNYYNEHSRQWVARHFAPEVERYGYSFDDYEKVL
jgi:hypothetical protein